MKKILLFFTLINFSCLYSQISYPFVSFHHFKTVMDSVTSISDESDREIAVNAFWDTLGTNRKIPFAFGDSVAFLYRSASSSVYWAGDFNGWNPNAAGYKGIKAGLSDINYTIKSFPSNARLDYKIVVNDNWILDPDNTYIQYSGFGPNSELRMPDYVYPEETIRKPWYSRGNLSNNLSISSAHLKYTVYFKVYTPYNYAGEDHLPVIYVTDGHEYSDDRMGSMIIVLDNLIYEGIIEPVIAVFIDPRSVPNSSGTNRRADQYTMNPAFADFAADELVPYIDANYKANPSPDARAILGTSLGGINSAYFGTYRTDKFHLIGIHSPAFWATPEIYAEYTNASPLPLKIFMSTGTINDTQDGARQMKSILENKGYPLLYIEVPEGHSWGNWRALLDEPLKYFFTDEIPVTVEEQNFNIPSEFRLFQNYPNPFNPSTIIKYVIPNPPPAERNLFKSTPSGKDFSSQAPRNDNTNVSLKVYDILGNEVATLVNEQKEPGYYEVEFDASHLTSGVYLYVLRAGDKFSSIKKMILVK